MSSYDDFVRLQQQQQAQNPLAVSVNNPAPAAPLAVTPGFASLVAPQQTNFSTMTRWGQPGGPTPAAAAAAAINPPMIGADYEQMPMGTNGLKPNEGMFAGSAVNNPIVNTAGGYNPTAFDKAFGWRDADGAHMGYAGAGIAGANLLMSGYLGLQQLAVAKDSLANAKKQFSLNFANQAKTTNAALEDRQRARVASNSGAYQSVGDYMNQNRVNGVA